MNQIPPLAWIALILIVLITIVINYVMIALLRNRGQMKDLTHRLQSRPPNRTVQTLQQVKEVIRDPFRQEREQLNALSQLVSHLNEPSPTGENPPNSREEQDPPYNG